MHYSAQGFLPSYLLLSFFKRGAVGNSGGRGGLFFPIPYRNGEFLLIPQKLIFKSIERP